MCVVATLLAAIALTATAAPARAANPELCSGEQVRGVFGEVGTQWETQHAHASVKAGKKIWVTGSVWTTHEWPILPGVGYAINFRIDSFQGNNAVFAQELNGVVPPAQHFSAWYAPSSDEVVDIRSMIATTGGGYYEYTVTIEDPAPCSHPFRSGRILGNGNPSEPLVCACYVAEPVDVETGNFFHEFVDFDLGGRGLGLGLSRVYNSADGQTYGPFGYGWHSSAFMSLAHSEETYQNVADTHFVSIRQETGSVTTFKAVGDAAPYAPVNTQTDATLTGSPTTGWTFTRGATEILHFDSQGKLTDVSDLNGNTLSYSYPDGVHLGSISDEASRSLNFTWTQDTQGRWRVDKVTDSAGSFVDYEIGDDGEMDWFKDVEGKQWTFTYDTVGLHRMEKMRDPVQLSLGAAGVDIVTSYDASGRVDWQRDRENGLTDFAYATEDDNTVTTVTDPAGDVTRYVYSHGLLIARTDGAGTADALTTRFEYDPVNLGVIEITDPYGGITTHGYDAAFNRDYTENPLGKTWTAQFNAFHQPEWTKDAKNVKTTYLYDGINLSSVSTPLIDPAAQLDANGRYPDGAPVVAYQTTTFQHVAPGGHPEDVSSIIDPRGKETKIEYEPAGWTKQIVDPELNKTKFEDFTIQGNARLTTTARGFAAGATATNHQIKRTFNKRGQLLTEKNQLQLVADPVKQTKYEYDDNGNLWKVTDAKARVTEFRYDGENRLEFTDLPDGSHPATVYHPDGKVWKQVDGLGKETTYLYDALDRVEQVTDADGRITATQYDIPSHSMTVTDNMARQTISGFDAAGRLESISYSDQVTPNVTFGYDNNNRKTSATQGGVAADSSWTFDSLGRLTSAGDGAGDPVAYGYLKPDATPDLGTEPTTITYAPGKVVTHVFDNAGRMISSKDWFGNVTKFDHDEENNLETIDPEGLTTNPLLDTFSHDAAGQLQSIQFKNGAATLGSLGYVPNAVGMLESETQTGLPGAASASYDYDGADRLTKLNGTTKWGYDAAGHITKLGDGQAQHYKASGTLCATARSATSACGMSVAQGGSEYLSPDATRYAFDGVGARTSTTPQVGYAMGYAYDQAGRLTTATPGDFRTDAPSGWEHSLVLRGDGTIAAFGRNDLGQLGDGTIIERRSPVDVANLRNMRAVSAGAHHSLAIDENGDVWAWGSNASNQLGNGAGGAGVYSNAPVNISAGSSLKNAVAVAGGGSFSLAVDATGAVWAWGANNKTQLGVTPNGTKRPQKITSGLANVVDVAAGLESSYALTSDGKVYAWGANGFRQLGYGGTTDQPTPQQITALVGTVTAIAAGKNHAYALMSDKSIQAWGDNAYGQLGQNDQAVYTVPKAVKNITTNGGAIKVAAGGLNGVALMTDGRVQAWGLGTSGQVGDGTMTNKYAPTYVASLTDISSIDFGNAAGVAVGEDGLIHTWGLNNRGQLGDGTTNTAAKPVMPEDDDQGFAPGGTFHWVSAKADGTVVAAGRNNFGQLGDGTTIDRDEVGKVAGLENIATVATGLEHSVALDNVGNVYTWGDNTFGQLGDSTTGGYRTLPYKVNISGVVAVATASRTTYARKADGTVWAWGNNDKAQLARNPVATPTSNVPLQIFLTGGVNPLTGVIGIAAGQASAYALKSDGTAVAWGANGYGQLGVGDTTQKEVPTAILNLTTTNKAIAISAGQNHAYALMADKSVKSWGRNHLGQLGNGLINTTAYPTPLPIPGGFTNAAKIAAGGYHGLALKTDGTVWAWGAGSEGQLGQGAGNTGNQSSPQLVNFAAPAPAIATIDAAVYGSAAISHANDLYVWGNNTFGQLGGTGNIHTPTKIAGALDTAATTYSYGADGLRLSKSTVVPGATEGLTTSFVWDRRNAVAGLLSETTGAATTYWIYGPDGSPYEQIDHLGNVTYLHHDRLGSIRMATNGAGAVTGAATWDAYGNQIAASGAMPKLGWAGEYRDTETGFVYLRARYYDPETAQFLSRDPIEAKTREAYGYVNGNPLNATDPSGLCGIFGDGPCTPGGIASDLGERGRQAADKVGGAVETVGRCIGDAVTCLDNMKKAVAPVVALGATITVGYGLVLACATLVGCFVAAPVMVPAIAAGGYATWRMMDELWFGEGHDKAYHPLGGHGHHGDRHSLGLRYVLC